MIDKATCNSPASANHCTYLYFTVFTKNDTKAKFCYYCSVIIVPNCEGFQLHTKIST
jgi:hypothetical protein